MCAGRSLNSFSGSDRRDRKKAIPEDTLPIRKPDWLETSAAACLLLLPILGTYIAGTGRQPISPATHHQTAITRLAGKQPPPVVAPVTLRVLSPDTARLINARTPFSTAPNPAARPFHYNADPAARERAMDCLAAAQYYEAGDDPVGQRAVAQVVLNRLRHPAFPKSICAVVFEGSDRKTGCQFTFTCDGALARTPPPTAWARARALADRMLSGLVERQVGYATHYHTDWVVPYWSSSLEKIAEVHSHLFFRWPGWWGTPGAFLRRTEQTEPRIGLIAFLSPAHKDSEETTAAFPLSTPKALNDNAQTLARGPILFSGKATNSGANVASSVHLVATSPAQDAFIVQIAGAIREADYLATAQTLCSGRVRCRVMGWGADSPAPQQFPIANGYLSSMLFSYIHDAGTGLQRLLWNCNILVQDNPRNCMRNRLPAPSSGPYDTPPVSGVVPASPSLLPTR